MTAAHRRSDGSVGRDPVIGVLSPERLIPQAQWGPATAVFDSYVAPLVFHGATPLGLLDHSDTGRIPQLLELLDGVLLAGAMPCGEDVPWWLFQDEPIPDGVYRNPRAVVFGIDLVREVLRNDRWRDMPVFGVCLGAQMLNVAAGGTVSKGAGHVGANGRTRVTRIHAQPGTWLDRLLSGGTGRGEGGSSCERECMHGYRIRRVGDGLAVSAYADDGVVEALVHEQRPWIRATLYHADLDAPWEELGAWVRLVRELMAGTRPPVAVQQAGGVG